ncbi:MAG: hypothetical protein AUI14_13005 [Actinobacteria bacterium 13_2_20CM_2_71_6]|nr:MAG: hypothetical protein AUI14_13005 [Actinobacteria bacterium 13_2_20CM_2_71_6]
MRYPGKERGEHLHEQAEAIERWSEFPERAHRGESAARMYEHLRGGPHGNQDEEEGPVVETVNPAYQPPPGTQEDIEALTADIGRTLAARARAEAERARAERVRDAAQAQGVQVRQTRDHVTEALAATREHQGQVQEHGQANERSAAQHQEGGGKVQDAGSRLAGVGTLEALLGGWTGFTGLVLRFSSVLPDRAVNAFQRMNNDSTQFMARLAHVKTGVVGQQAQQPARGAQIAQTGARIAGTGTRAQGTQEQFTQAAARGAELAQINQDHVATADADRAAAADAATRADTAATGLVQRRESLAAQMAAWAAAHRAARQQAIDETARRLEARGLRVTHRP